MGVSKNFGSVHAIADIDLEVERGQFVTFLGPSGCGKTTSLRLIAGFYPPSAGAIEIGGRAVSDVSRNIFVPPGQRNLGMVFQDYALWPHMNVLDNTVYPLRIARVGKTERRRKAEWILSMVRMEGMEARFPHELSGGQQQRVALARALIAGPRVLLLDEPLSNLDAALRESMRAEIRGIHKRLGVTVLFVTHDQVEAMAMSDRIVVMEAGRIHQVGSPNDLFDDPADPFVAAFMARANLFPVVLQAGAPHIRTEGHLLPLKADRIDGRLDRGQGCIKAGDISLLRPDPRPPGDELRCRIVGWEFMGDTVLYTVETSGLTLQVKSADRSLTSLAKAFLHFRRVILF